MLSPSYPQGCVTALVGRSDALYGYHEKLTLNSSSPTQCIYLQYWFTSCTTAATTTLKSVSGRSMVVLEF